MLIAGAISPPISTLSLYTMVYLTHNTVHQGPFMYCNCVVVQSFDIARLVRLHQCGLLQ